MRIILSIKYLPHSYVDEDELKSLVNIIIVYQRINILGIFNLEERKRNG